MTTWRTGVSEEEEEKATHQVKNRSQEEKRRLTKSHKIPWLIYMQDEQYIQVYVETRRPEPGPAGEEHVPPPPPAPLQPPQPTC